MKISLDTEDVKKAIREFVQNRRIIQPDTNITMELVPLRQGEEKLRVDIIIHDALEDVLPSVSTETEELTQNNPESAEEGDGQLGLFDNLKG